MSDDQQASNVSPMDEPEVHFIFRQLQQAIRVLAIALVVATMVLLVFYRDAAHLAAIPIPLLLVVLAVVNYQERSSQAKALRQHAPGELTEREIVADMRAAGVLALAKIAGSLALGTFVIAATMFELSQVAFVAAVALLLTIFFGLPYWPLIVLEAEQDEREKLTHDAS